MSEIASPCINVCRIDPRSGLCEGCFRTLDEIAAWGTASEGVKGALLGQIARRRAGPAARAEAMPVQPDEASVRTIDWYFDFVSPYAYLQSTRLASLPASISVRYKPVLFAGLLEHWGTRGPAELPGKRRFIYRQVQWIARDKGIALRFPPAHPFNPLPLLRLACALDCRPGVIHAIFNFIWAEGRDPAGSQEWLALSKLFGLADADALIAASDAREQLRRHGEEAIAAGVFGVPSFVVDGEIFWGFDATDMMSAYLIDPSIFAGEAFARVDALPVGAVRKGRRR